MFIQKKKVLFLALTVISSYTTLTHAATIDFRHEYKSDSQANANRIKISGSSGNDYFSVEMKYSGSEGSGGGFNNLERGDSEFEYGHKFKLNDKWLIQPSMPITMGNEKTSFKPQVRVYYYFDSGITAKVRYRYKYTHYTDDNGSDSQRLGEITTNLTYTWDKLVQLDFESDYSKSYDGIAQFNNKDYNYYYNLKLGYKIPNSKWRPYVEFGNVSVSSSSDERQLRSRLGITYSF